MIAARLRSLVEDELKRLARELAHARRGKDRSVHKARKTLQRLRAVVMLFRSDPKLLRDENRRLQSLRRRLAPLRDAAARSETFRLLATRRHWSAWKTQLRQLAAAETERHAAAWAQHGRDDAFWRRIDDEAAELALRAAAWPYDEVDRTTIDEALARAGKRLEKRIIDARGEAGRELRHDLRRKLRRYANLRRAAAEALHREDADGEKLLSLAKRFGHEGDLWMALATARRVGKQDAAVHALALELEAFRRRQCARHDGLLRGPLK